MEQGNAGPGPGVLQIQELVRISQGAQAVPAAAGAHRAQTAKAGAWAIVALVLLEAASEILQAIITGTLTVPPGVLAVVAGLNLPLGAALTFLIHELQGQAGA